MSNIKLTVAYDGTAYCGWQRQKKDKTVQGAIEAALEVIAKEKVTLYGSGRTDAGVHALGQTANFHSPLELAPESWQRALNAALPPDIVVREARRAADDFHARYRAKSKRYRYRILTSPLPSPFERNYAWRIPRRLDLEKMKEAARGLTGRRDFTSFQASGGDIKNTVRNLESLDLELRGEILRFELAADGFLRHMVRNIVGTLVEVGRGKLAPSAMGSILAARDRSAAGPTAPPQGLWLVAVEY